MTEMGKGSIALMGSGELTTTMVEVHKELVSASRHTGSAFFIDTPAGFQLNADDISKKARAYFKRHVQADLSVASLKSVEKASDFELKQVTQQLDKAGYILIGPGSPTYACRQLRQTPIPRILARTVAKGGSLAIASAAALTSGTHTLPVYEIYKVGQAPHWVEGLDILGFFGLKMVVIPHWNNAEGGTHDTRFCYMGEPRLKALEQLLPQKTRYLGIDEHTALILDCRTRQARVEGLGRVTLRQSGREITFEKGESVSFGLLCGEIESGKKQAKPVMASHSPGSNKAGPPPFWEQVRQSRDRFKTGLETRNFKSSISALLVLDSHINMAVTETEGEGEEIIAQAREIFRDLIALMGVEMDALGQKAETLFDPLVNNLLKLRTEHKEKKEWALADAIRHVLEESRIQITDTKEGYQWRIKP